MIRWERIRADEAEPGDWIARTRNDEPVQVASVRPGAKSRYILFVGFGAYRIRPRHETPLWRAVER